MYKWQSLDTKQQDIFFKEHGVRWYEFAHVPYFNTIIQMIIINPMHNFIIGVLKNHWYDTWILGKALHWNTEHKDRELGFLHKHLDTFEMPAFVGHPAKQVGETAGGSLSVDTYKGLGTVLLPIMVCMLHKIRLRLISTLFQIPLLWEPFLLEAEEEFVKLCKMYPDILATWEAKHRPSFWGIGTLPAGAELSRSGKPKKPRPPLPVPVRHMQVGEDRLFLQLTTALKILTQYEITALEQMKPNLHFAVHLPDQVLDYGPVYGTWCFLGEWLDKLLKSFKTNNWGEGQLEVSMMRAWGCDIQMQQCSNP
ncbi:hypothetical protein K439DRAFT_1375334 [Ramaria rubella]|nr:hypothetical protein K439DRAFT_1375334 [Ramaria rubella]